MRAQNGPDESGENPAWQIERLDAKDAARLKRLAWECYPPYYEYLWHPGGMEAYLNAAFDTTLLAAELSDDNLVYEIVHDNGKDLAFLKWHRRADTEGCPDAAYLERVYVSPEGAGRRIGSALIMRAVEGARAEGRRWIWLRAMADLPQVLARYEAAGFVTFGNTAITTPGVRADRAGMVMMRCALD